MFHWQDFLNTAKFLHGQAANTGAEEAAYRSSVSRAYYATWKVACELLQVSAEFRYRFKDSGDDHEGVARYLDGQSDRELKKVALALNSLRAWRHKADHKSPAVTRGDAAMCILQGERALADLDSAFKRYSR